jgi:hypothetical protein
MSWIRMTYFRAGIGTGTFEVAAGDDVVGETVYGNPRATETSATRQVLSFPNRRKHKMETW